MQIKIKKFFKYGKIMKGNVIDGPLYLTSDLTGPAVGVLIVDQKKRQEIVPEIPFKSMTYRNSFSKFSISQVKL